MSSVAARIWSLEGGSSARWRSLSRTEPMSRDCAVVMVPSLLPRMSSVEPPPMSTTSIGSGRGGSSRVAPEKLTRASSSPSITSGLTPTRWRIPSTNSSAFSASRVAEVAQNLISATSCCRTMSMYSSAAANARCREASAIRPVRSTPWPNRTMRISRTSSSLVPASASRSATRRRNELVPQSKAATRVMGSPRDVVSRRSLTLAPQPPGGRRRVRCATSRRAVPAPRRRAGSRPVPGRAPGRRARAGT